MTGYMVTVSQVDAPEGLSSWSLKYDTTEEPTIGLKRLQEAVDGRVECVSLNWDAMGKLDSFDLDVWVNEEGLLHSLPQNPAVSLFASYLSGHSRFLVGNAIITGMDYDSGETVPLTKDQAVHVMAMLEAVTELSGGFLGDPDA